MKQIFFDKNQPVVIKVFLNSKVIEREECGIKAFSNLVNVPKLEKLDTKVAKISFLPGFLGYQIPEEQLNKLIANMLLEKKVTKVMVKFSIKNELAVLKNNLKSKQFQLMLKEVEEGIKNVPLVPVHGDLQKQNMIITGGKLGLIDFEHFIFAPKELELANSLFFNDGNCLDVKNTVSQLPNGFIDKEILNLMLNFFFLKQISFGMSEIEAKKRLLNALKKVEELRNSSQKIDKTTTYFCFV